MPVAIVAVPERPVVWASPMALRLPVRSRVIEFLLALSVCLLMTLSALVGSTAPAAGSEGAAAEATAGEQRDTQAGDQHGDGHGVLHALSLCVAVVAVAGVLGLVGVSLYCGARLAGCSAEPVARPGSSVAFHSRLRSRTTAGVLLRV